MSLIMARYILLYTLDLKFLDYPSFLQPSFHYSIGLVNVKLSAEILNVVLFAQLVHVKMNLLQRTCIISALGKILMRTQCADCFII